MTIDRCEGAQKAKAYRTYSATSCTLQLKRCFNVTNRAGLHPRPQPKSILMDYGL